MYGFAGEADPESAAVLTAALDPFTGPRRGGPRFVDPDEQECAKAIVDDPRTTERIALDALVELVRVGAAVDPRKAQRRMRAVVTIVTTVETVRTGVGFGVLENDQSPVSPETVAAGLCCGDAVELTMTTDGAPLDLGRTRRLYDQRQRAALAVRDGGCLWPECTQPPAFTEAHHTRQWKRDTGATDIDHGVLLCRFHHMLLHNNHWEIQRLPDAGGGRNPAGDQVGFWLIPPKAVDSEQHPIALHSKSLLIRQLQGRRAG